MVNEDNSPGVYIQESDKTVITNNNHGNNVLVIGFAKGGPIYVPTQVSSISEFESIFGKPSNAAERYLYYSAKEVLNPNALVTVVRIPYTVPNPGEDDKYSCLVYPIFPIPST
jgi:hypothetical protein